MARSAGAGAGMTAVAMPEQATVPPPSRGRAVHALRRFTRQPLAVVALTRLVLTFSIVAGWTVRGATAWLDSRAWR